MRHQSEGTEEAISDSETVADNVDGGTPTEMSLETAETSVEKAVTEEPFTDSSGERDDTVETSHSGNQPSENVSASLLHNICVARFCHDRLFL